MTTADTVSSRYIRHLASFESCLPQIARFASVGDWRGAETTGSNLHFEAEHPGTTKPYRLHLSAIKVPGTVGGVSVKWTQARVEALFPDDTTPSQEEKAAARADAERAISALETRLQRHVPREFTQVIKNDSRVNGSLVSLAYNASRHLDNPAVFKGLVEAGSWQGSTRDANDVTVNLQIRLNRAPTEAAQQSLTVDASVAAEDFGRLGERTATATCEAAVDNLFGHIRQQLVGGRTKIASTEVVAHPHIIDNIFHSGSSALFDSVIESKLGGPGEGRLFSGPRNQRQIVQTVDPATRAVIDIGLPPTSDGHLNAAVRVKLERTGNRHVAFKPEELAHWQATVDDISDALAKSTAQEAVAPAFEVDAGADTVHGMLKRQLAECFPSDRVLPIHTGFAIDNFELADQVFGKLEVHIHAVGEWKTRVTFHGDIFGIGLPREPGAADQSRLALRDAIAKSATEIHRQLNAELMPPVPGRGIDFG